ncbi:hypothetical protein F4804DRAFT_30306 [Jackrogersella minutella]|nr:hypothetical protein F4804DRAFT_30306 [Jackrogersella minutella]
MVDITLKPMKHQMASAIHTIISSPSSSPTPTLTLLPTELIASVLFYLADRDIKNLRLTCAFIRHTAHLHLTRPFSFVR